MSVPALLLVVTGAAVIASCVGQALLTPRLRRWQLLDKPNERSSHAIATPRGGGLGVMLGVLVGIGTGLVSGAAPSTALAVVVGAGVVLAIVGLTDDVSEKHPALRLAAQFVVGLVSAAILTSIIEADLPITLVLTAFGCFWLVGTVNAVNFMDGVNGISGLTGAVAGGWYAATALSHGDVVLAICGAAVTGACLGFLPWNAPRARVFLGDVGSYGLGALLGTLALATALVYADPIAAVAPLSVYLADTSTTLFRRWRAGESLQVAHRDHAYQRLVLGGWSHSQASLLAAGVALVVCVVIAATTPWMGVSVALVLLAAYVALPTVVERKVAV